MPAIKGRRVGQKKEDTVEDSIVPENDDNISVEDAPTTKPKGRAVMKKGKAADSKKDDDNEVEDDDSANGKGDEDVTVEKTAPKPKGKGAVKKPSAKESEDSEEPIANKKASKRGNAKDASEETGEAVKPKKNVKKGEVLPTRRGGERAAKKVISYELEEKVPAKKSRGTTKSKNGVSKVAAKEKRGRAGKKVTEEVQSDDEMETAEDPEAVATTVSVEH